MSARGRKRGEMQAAGQNGARARRPAALTLRLAQQGDEVPLRFFFDAVLRKDYFVPRRQLGEILAQRYHQVWVAEIDMVLVGVAVTTRGTRLVNLLVHPGYRGLGVGRALLDASGAAEVRVKTDMSTGDPSEFYLRLGFVRTGGVNGKGNIKVMRRPATRRRVAGV
ncbi:MAG: GNAT family N-acetyltransferase [Planctomycetes bacterium]|nr:GNAT family N-acetyltransferase [Planctomycetota bacterium]